MDVYRRLMKLFKKGNLLLSVISGSSVFVCMHVVIFSVKFLEVLAPCGELSSRIKFAELRKSKPFVTGSRYTLCSQGWQPKLPRLFATLQMFLKRVLRTKVTSAQSRGTPADLSRTVCSREFQTCI